MDHGARRSATRASRPNEVRLAVRGLILLTLSVLPAALAVDFDSQIRPLIEQRCLACHRESNKLGGLSLESGADASAGGANGPSVVAGDPDASLLLARLLLPSGTPGAMPPAGGPLTEPELALVRTWILEGAPWPSPLVATQREGPEAADENELELVRRIHGRLERRMRDAAENGFDAYDETVPGSDVVFQMVPVPAGEFIQGTPPSEEGREADEGPLRRIRLDAFWMGAREVSWDEFRGFMLREAEGYLDPDDLVAAVSSPTPPYMEMSFGMGINGYPAISMTQHAASKYAQWLSSKTGRFYRLPTEAEWEYACRAGTSSAYSFGDDPASLADYAWYWDNSNAQYQAVGTKRPNAWGLHDMHGNVWEWTLDRHEPSYGGGLETEVHPWARADALYPRVVRGGSWMDDAPALRCGSRRASEEGWKMQDPQLPKSIWYHTDAQWLGFRLVRPVQLPSPEQMYAYWNSAAGKD